MVLLACHTMDSVDSASCCNGRFRDGPVGTGQLAPLAQKAVKQECEESWKEVVLYHQRDRLPSQGREQKTSPNGKDRFLGTYLKQGSCFCTGQDHTFLNFKPMLVSGRFSVLLSGPNLVPFVARLWGDRYSSTKAILIKNFGTKTMLWPQWF